MSVLIGIAVGRSPYANFYAHVMGLDRPSGSRVSLIHNPCISHARNVLAEEALEGGFDHLLFLDDDHAVPKHALMQLLSSNLDIVGGYYVTRGWPFRPVVGARWDPNDPTKAQTLQPVGMSGLVRVVTIGTGCLLVRTSVFKKLIEHMRLPAEPGDVPRHWFVAGVPIPDLISEDWQFCRMAAEAGFHIHVDLDLRLGHYMQATVAPYLRADGRWTTACMSEGEVLHFPPAWELKARQTAKRSAKEGE